MQHYRGLRFAQETFQDNLLEDVNMQAGCRAVKLHEFWPTKIGFPATPSHYNKPLKAIPDIGKIQVGPVGPVGRHKGRLGRLRQGSVPPRIGRAIRDASRYTVWIA